MSGWPRLSEAMVLCVHSRRKHRRMAQQKQQPLQQPQPQQHRMNGSNNSGSSLYGSYHGEGPHQHDPPPYPGHLTQFYTPGTVYITLDLFPAEFVYLIYQPAKLFEQRISVMI